MLDILIMYIDTVCVYIRLNFRRNHSEPLDLIDDAMKAINDSHDMTRRRRYQQLWWLPTDMVMQGMNWENVWTKKLKHIIKLLYIYIHTVYVYFNVK